MDNIQNRCPTYKSIDLAKFFFSICIVFLHSNALSMFPFPVSFVIEKAIVRLAVPFFFVISGYFLGKKMDLSSPKYAVHTYIKRLTVPFIFWGAINTALEFIILVKNGGRSPYVILSIIRHIMFYPYGSLWYVYASIIGAALLVPFMEKGKIDLALKIGCILYLFALLCNNYYFIAESLGIDLFINWYLAVFISPRNGIFVGFLMLGIGVKLSQVFSLRERKSKKNLIFTIILYALYLFEIAVIRNKPSTDDGALYICLPLFVSVFVMFVLNSSVNISDEKSRLLRRMSTGLYWQHRMWLSLLGIFNISINVTIKTLIVIIVSLLVCIIAYNSKSAFLNKVLL